MENRTIVSFNTSFGCSTGHPSRGVVDVAPFNTSETNHTIAGSGGSPKSINYSVAVIYCIIFAVGTSGNLFLLLVNIFRRSRKQSATQIFIISLSISDLGLLLGVTWMRAYSALNSSWIFGVIICKVTNLWAFIACGSSVWILSVIGIDRYFSLSKPDNRFFSARGARLAIIAVWVGMVATGVPLLIWCDLVKAGTSIACTIVGVSSDSMAIHILAGRIITFFIPVAIIVVCYFGIWYKMNFSKQKITPASGVKPPEQNVSRKVARMCTFLVSTLIVLWTPFQIDMLFIAYGSNKLIARSLSSPLFILANANSCINPVVYGFMWKPMREALLHMIGRYFKQPSNASLEESKSNTVSRLR